MASDLKRPRAEAEADKPKPVLYSSPMTRGVIVEWALDEFGLNDKFDKHQVDFAAKEHKTKEYLENVHPYGRVPALVNGDQKIFEGGAILLYIADKYLNAAATTPEDRADLAKWVLYANSSLPDALTSDEYREKQMAECLTALDKALEGKQFLVGDKLSVADISVAACLLWCGMAYADKGVEYSAYPNITNYLANLKKSEHAGKYFP